jgi:hypothetical protein
MKKATTPEVVPIVLNAVQALVKDMNTAKRLAQLATDLFLMKILEKFPLDDVGCNAKRQEMFKPLLYGKAGGKQYFQTLLKLIVKNDCPSEQLMRISNQLMKDITDDGDEPMLDAEKSDDGDEIIEEIKEEDDDDEEEDDDDEEEDDDNHNGDSDEREAGNSKR